jgi:tetratricopeptide (TPR) repeat protein
MAGELESMLGYAARLRREGRAEAAASAYEKLLEQFPGLPDSWYNLALLQRQLGRFEAALASYLQALNRGAREPEQIHLNRGVIYADCLLRADDAERELRQALALNPDYVPALLNLGNLKEDRGDREAARRLYEQALDRDPACWEALARLGNLAPTPKAGDPLIGRLRNALTGDSAAAADKASLGFALGRMLDAVGDYDEAFTAYQEANAMSRASAPGRGGYDRARQERLVDALIAAFSAPRPVGGTAPAPIFICGMFRSGSTLAERALAAHPRVTAGGELPLLPEIVDDLAPFPFAAAQASPKRIAALAERYLASLSSLFPAADLVTDKRPDNFLHIGLIKALFPAAKIVHTVRNPLDNCLSVFFLHLDNRMTYALDLLDTGHFYAQHRRLMAHWKSLYGADMLEFNYDAFVAEPRLELERLLSFCGLDWNENCLSFHRQQGEVKTASVWQVREPLYKTSSGRWRHYERHLAALRAYLDEASSALM